MYLFLQVRIVLKIREFCSLSNKFDVLYNNVQIKMKPTPNALFISAARGLAEVGSRYGEYKLYFMERSGAWKIN